MMPLTEIGSRARRAADRLVEFDAHGRESIVQALADAVEAAAPAILEANRADIAAADGLSDALIDRLRLDEHRLGALVADTRRVAELPDPVGRDLEDRLLPNGIRLIRRSVPIGVIGVIYEARPNVTVDIAALCLKTGNAAILRGGKETVHTNRALATAITAGLVRAGAPEDAVQQITDPDRDLVRGLLRLDSYVDMIIPRGGAGLHRLCREEATIPVITGGIGICHLFADASADPEMVANLVENAKVQRPTVCNALDTLLVHRSAAHAVLPVVARRLRPHGVELRADPAALAVLAGGGESGDRSGDRDARDARDACDVRDGRDGRDPNLLPAGPDDFDREWLSLVLGIRIVEDLDAAIDHIRTHSTRHSDGIITEDPVNADLFVQRVDSSAVYVNASTRFTDGGQFGLGAEVAVSTQKLHARGPMGLEALTTYKWIGLGAGHVRP